MFPAWQSLRKRLVVRHDNFFPKIFPCSICGLPTPDGKKTFPTNTPQKNTEPTGSVRHATLLDAQNRRRRRRMGRCFAHRPSCSKRGDTGRFRWLGGRVCTPTLASIKLVCCGSVMLFSSLNVAIFVPDSAHPHRPTRHPKTLPIARPIKTTITTFVYFSQPTPTLTLTAVASQ